MKKLEEIYLDVKKHVEEYLTGSISAADLKHATAPLGIYQQRNDLFMMRIRITGGHVTVSQLEKIADIMNMYKVGFSHITSRQDLQLQDVPTRAIYPILRQCLAEEMPFLGGGGNTFRNILVSSDSGITPNEIFDVLPYAQALKDFLFSYDKAFELPRKLKIGFSSGPDDSIKAPLQDLGLIAKIQNGARGFEVYAGGGMGRESMVGVKLFDFLPEDQLLKCAKAIVDLFYDHGDRTDRNRARLRFVLKKLGPEKFIDLFNGYFKKTDAALNINLPIIDLTEQIKRLCLFNNQTANNTLFKEWLKYAVSETGFGNEFVSVRLFVPYGNLSSDILLRIILLAQKCGISFARLTQSQDIILPLVHASALPIIFDDLIKNFPDSDLTVESFKGHLTSCIGATVCKIGIADSPALSDQITDALDEHFQKNPEKKADSILPILNSIKISGCINACSGHASSKIGLQGMKKKIDDILAEGAVIFTGDNKSLGTSQDKFLAKDELGQIAGSLVTVN